MYYVGFELTPNSRLKLMELFPPKYSRVFGHHITTKFGTKSEDDIPDYTEDVQVVAHSDSGDGLEALVVRINGNSRKEDGNLFHITWSLDPEKYKPFDSNKLVSNRRTKINPVPIQVVPMIFKGKTPYVDKQIEEQTFTTFLEYLKSV